jgi:hypothetical protein
MTRMSSLTAKNNMVKSGIQRPHHGVSGLLGFELVGAHEFAPEERVAALRELEAQAVPVAVQHVVVLHAPAL